MWSACPPKKIIELCNDDPCHQQMGIRALEISKERGVCRLELKAWHLNLENVIHGGILFSVMDSTMGFCIYPHLEKDERILAIDLKINYLKPARREMKTVRCEAKLVARTRRLAVSEGELLSPDGGILCKALGTFAILKKKE